jgi:glycosyltransferase involved in cell wall biosynthesis
MRIGIFGNTNNYPLLLAMGLRELGHHVHLVVNRLERLHRPESKYPEFANGYPDWILDCSQIPEDDFVAGSPRIGPVLDFLAEQSHGLVLNHLGPSLLEFCPLPAVALMSGSDLSYYADRRTPTLRQQGWAPHYVHAPGGRFVTRKWEEFVARQRAGILASEAVSAPPVGLTPEVDEILRDIGVPDTRRDFFYIADTLHQTRRTRASNPVLRVVNGARLNWLKPLPPGFSSQDHKGSDILLSGFAEFIAGGGEAELILFRKGLHVRETEALARSLNIESRIVWRDEVGLLEFYDEIAQSDVVSDQLGDSFPGLVALDAMALGVPVIANFHPEILEPCLGAPIAACQARTASDVATHLGRLAASPDVRRTAGIAGQQFTHAHLSPRANAVKCVRYLQDACTRTAA